MDIDKKDVISIVAVIAGTIAAWYLNNELGLGGVVASAIVGLIGGAVFNKLSPQIFCGSFVGMCSCSVISTIYYTILFGAVAGVIFVAWKGYFFGHGGKLGTTAFMAVLFSLVLLAIAGVEYNAVSDAALESLTVSWFLFVLLVGVISTVATYYLRKDVFIRVFTNKCADAVLGSATVGLIAGLLFPEVSATYGATLAFVAYSGSFAGMTAFPRIFDRPVHFAIAGIFVAMLYTATVDLVPGGGGKLGTIAFVSVIITRYISEHHREVRKWTCEQS
ncbi:MAG TPA: hypothetical protein ENN11_04200 [Methanomicrobia archaeon]|nr:hypothetical protein [Methanomicrobia archaeon]